MFRGAVLKAEIRTLSRTEFLSRYPHPFFIRELPAGEPGAIGFSTSVGSVGSVGSGGSVGSSIPNPDLAQLANITMPSLPVYNPSAGPPSERNAAILAASAAPKSAPNAPSSTRMVTRMQLYPDRYELVPVQKREENPWQDRILIGRATNNDIILREPSVSKSHAHLAQESDGSWLIHAKKTVNGTLVDGRVVEAGSTCTLRAGSTLQFGNVHCEFIENGALYDLFSR
jgi:hypothetical protein